MIHRCQILKADLKHRQHPWRCRSDASSRLKIIMLNFATPSAGGPYLLVDKHQDACRLLRSAISNGKTPQGPELRGAWIVSNMRSGKPLYSASSNIGRRRPRQQPMSSVMNSPAPLTRGKHSSKTSCRFAENFPLPAHNEIEVRPRRIRASESS